MSDTLVTYATPLDRAKAIRDDLIAFATARAYSIPTTRFVQVGEIVRDCESVIVSVGSLTPDPLYDPVQCVSPRSANFLVEIIRACAVVYDQQGLTIPSILEDVSDQASSDGELLYEFAQELDGWSSKQPWSVVWSLAEGGLSVTSLQITMGIS